MTEEEFLAETDSYKDKEWRLEIVCALYPEVSRDSFCMTKYDISRTLTTLKLKGIVDEFLLGSDLFYYFHMLGGSRPVRTKREDGADSLRPGRSENPNISEAEKEREKIKDGIWEVMKDGSERTIEDIMREVPELQGKSNQATAAFVRQMKDAGALERIEINRKAYFRAKR